MAAAKGRRSADDRVLNAIFNPEDPLDDDGQHCEEEEEGHEDVQVDSEQVREAKVLEVQAVKEAEQGNLGSALALLTEAITLAPEYPSPYNNRAQVYRLQANIDLAMADLNTAVLLSSGRGRTARQALTQRGLIHRLHGNDEAAKIDFHAAAKLGSKFAGKQTTSIKDHLQRWILRRDAFCTSGSFHAKFPKEIHRGSTLVEMNPYAALCGEMLSEAFDKIRRGEHT